MWGFHLLHVLYSALAVIFFACLIHSFSALFNSLTKTENILCLAVQLCAPVSPLFVAGAMWLQMASKASKRHQRGTFMPL